jgi:phosphate transport system protein
MVEEELKTRLLDMGEMVQEMIRLATQSLLENQAELSGKVSENEHRVNHLHMEIDDRCLKFIALHQPTAADLRFILAAVKINSDLERIGDQAVNIAENTVILLQRPQLDKKLLDIPRMAELANGMLKDSLAAFVGKDVELAKSVIRRDDEEDRLKSQAFHELMRIMQSDASTIQQALCLILIARNLERVADHATNIAEDVIFMVLGKDTRHPAEGGSVA